MPIAGKKPAKTRAASGIERHGTAPLAKRRWGESARRRRRWAAGVMSQRTAGESEFYS